MNGQVALICGSSGRVGSAIAINLASKGVYTALHFRNNSALTANLIEQICSLGGKATSFQADLTDETSIIKMLEAIKTQCGDIQIVVNTVHGDADPKNVIDMGWSDWQVHLEALKVHFLVCKSILPMMRRQKYGRIIFISAGLSKRYYQGCSAYSTVKAGLNAFCKTLALEEGQFGITVNIVAPGKVIPIDDRPTSNNPQAWDELDQIALDISPLGRDATAMDVAEAVSYFASPEASCITGQTLFVTGGEIMP